MNLEEPTILIGITGIFISKIPVWSVLDHTR